MTNGDVSPDVAVLEKLKQAKSLLSSHELQAALDLFQEALAMDGQTAETLAQAGQGLVEIAMQVRGNAQLRIFGMAEEVLREAVRYDWGHAVARDGLQKVGAVLYSYHPKHDEESKKYIDQGTKYFIEGDYPTAAQHYSQALQYAPDDSQAAKYLGDCYFCLGQYDEAIQYFTLAAELAPTDPQAFKFLADAYSHKGNLTATKKAAYGTIAAHPRYWSGWMLLDRVVGTAGVGLRTFRLRPVAWASIAEDGSGKIDVDPHAAPALVACWMVHATAVLNAIREQKSVFEREHAGLKAMSQHIAEMLLVDSETTSKVLPYELLMLPEFDKRGDLRPLVFLFRFHDQMRAEFEGWKQEWAKATGDPSEGVSNFLTRNRLRAILALTNLKTDRFSAQRQWDVLPRVGKGHHNFVGHGRADERQTDYRGTARELCL